MGETIKRPAVRNKLAAPKTLKEKSRVRDFIAVVGKWGGHQRINVIEAGVTKSEVEKVKSQTGLDYDTLANILSVTKATLHKKKGDERFNIVVSERLLLLADMYAYGMEVFGDKDKLNRWLFSKIIALDFSRPVDLLNTTTGMQEVKQIIGRIAYGVYS